MHESANQKLNKLRVDELLDLSKNEADGPRVLLRIQTKTADYTVLETDSGTLFTTYGDTGAIVFTLPSNPKRGLFYLFFQATDQNMSVNSAAANGIITFNDLDADGATFVSSSNKIGALLLVFGDGNIWNACALTANTLTVTT